MVLPPRRTDARARAVRSLLAAVIGAALAACATGVTEVPSADPGATRQTVVAMQSTALTPRNGGEFVGADALRAGDILHMREGDMPSVKVRQTLVYVGHLKYTSPLRTSEPDTGVQ